MTISYIPDNGHREALNLLAGQLKQSESLNTDLLEALEWVDSITDLSPHVYERIAPVIAKARGKS